MVVEASRAVRWSVMALTCTLMLGNYYCYDIPSSINKQIQHHLEMEDAQFDTELNLYYSLYSLPNIVLPFFGGAIIDKVGVQRMVVVLAVIVTIGQVFFAFGIQYRVIFLTWLGRCVFGIGGETLGVAQSTMAALWFSPDEVHQHGSGLDLDVDKTRLVSDSSEELIVKEQEVAPVAKRKNQRGSVALAMGLNLAVSRMGSVINDFISPLIAITSNAESNSKGVIEACWFGTFVCVMSCFGAALLAWLDVKYRVPKEGKVEFIPLDQISSSPEIIETAVESTPVDDKRRRSFGFQKVRHIASQLNLTYWVVCLAMVFSYGTIIPFNAIHSAFLQARFSMDPVVAAQVMAIPDTISVFLTPFTGSFVDRFGHRVHVLAVCSFLLLLVHLTLGLSKTANAFVPYVPLGVLGVCYAFLLLFWPIFTLLVPKPILSTSYGVASCILNLSLTIFPMIVAVVTSWDRTYYAVEMLFVGCACTCIVLLFWVMKLDKSRHGSVLKRGKFPSTS